MAEIPKVNTNIESIKLSTETISSTNDLPTSIPNIKTQNNIVEEVNLNPKTLDFSKIATNANDALNGNFIEESKIKKDYWNLNELTFKENEKGCITIYKGDTILGFTTLQNNPIASGDSQISANEKPVEPISNEKEEIEVLEDSTLNSNLNTESSRNFEGIPLSYNEIYNVSDNPLTRSKGVVNFNNHKETYYSQKVLPGGGLDIPGRHVAMDGTVRDELGFICISASPDYLPKGTTIMTSLGPAKVYDQGQMDIETIDIYVDW